jgi:hypothetical protein
METKTENKTYAREDKRNENILYCTCAVPRGLSRLFLAFRSALPFGADRR